MSHVLDAHLCIGWTKTLVSNEWVLHLYRLIQWLGRDIIALVLLALLTEVSMIEVDLMLMTTKVFIEHGPHYLTIIIDSGLQESCQVVRALKRLDKGLIDSELEFSLFFRDELFG